MMKFVLLVALALSSSTLAWADDDYPNDQMNMKDPCVASFALGMIVYVEAGLCQNMKVYTFRFEQNLRNWKAGQGRDRADDQGCYDVGVEEGRDILGKAGVLGYCTVMLEGFSSAGKMVSWIVGLK
jgi:hypothetical protein